MTAPAPYNPRYTAYAQAHGKTPEEMLAYDRGRFPGGANAGFLLWIQESLQDFRKVNPGAFVCNSLHDHPAFTAHLLEVARTQPAIAPAGTGQACGAANACHLYRGHEGKHQDYKGNRW